MGIDGQFNKIINLYFLDKDGNETEKKIICSLYGRKPEIEIVGKFMAADGNLPAFTITVTNLYFNLTGFQYPMIKVEAGYKGNLVKFKGSIMSMFQESPGPDGKTVIICYLGTLSSWLQTVIEVNYDMGTTLKDIIENLSGLLGFNGSPKIPADIQSLTIPAKFEENGTAASIFQKLFNLFPDLNLHENEMNGQLNVYRMNEESSNSVKTVVLEYLRSPPQKNQGGENGSYWVVFTAPWNPSVMPGVKVIFPAWQYIKFLNLVNSASETNAVIVQFVEIHFSTNGGANEMKVSGLGVKA